LTNLSQYIIIGNMSLPRYRCKRCGHEWIPRMASPRVCPKCKSPYWEKEARKVEYLKR